MKFTTEEGIDEWFANEKQKLEEEFLKKINKDNKNIPKYREKFDADLKRLLAKYEVEFNKFLDKKDFSKSEE